MRAPFDLLLKGGMAATPAGLIKADIGVRDQKIAEIGDLSGASAETEVSANHLHVLPGLIDSQVHFREPGLEHKEDLETGGQSAALGGIACFFEMPNTKPNTDTAQRLAHKVAAASNRSPVDFAFFVGATEDNAGQLAQLERLPGCCGVKIFMGSSTGTLLVDDDRVLSRVLACGRRRVAVHCEDESRLKERRHLVEGPDAHVRMHPHWRDEQTALLATQRLLHLAREAGRRVHVLHVTTADEALLLEQHKDIATMEVTPQHLLLTAPDCYERLGTRAQMNPPIREAKHQQALWRAVKRGVVDVIGSDHAPHTNEEKDRPYPKSPSGLVGVQTTVPLMLDQIHRGNLTLMQLVELMAHGPQRIYGLAGKGRLSVGYDADFSLVDLNAKRTIRNDDMATRAGWTPFDGVEVTGWPISTIVRGQTVMRDGQLIGEAIGQPARFVETLAQT